MQKQAITTEKAPASIGPYSTAVRCGDWVFLSGQIALPPTDQGGASLVSAEIAGQTHQVFKNLSAVVQASDGKLSDIVKLNIYLTDLENFSVVNEIMNEIFDEPYPARATVEVSALPKGALVEIDAIMCCNK
ncbi:MAG: RidA family protein [Gammaproteobacteria bacterium]|nr:RidA family protein [Gammaproteobacteria bacterium]